MSAPNTYLGTIEVAERECSGTEISVVGAINALGYVLCRECSHPHDLYLTAVLSDSAPHNADECDMCGISLNAR